MPSIRPLALLQSSAYIHLTLDNLKKRELSGLRSWLLQKKDRVLRPQVGFGDLPREIVIEIATYLTHIDHLCLALTCKSFLLLLDGSLTLQRMPKFRQSTENPPVTFSIGMGIMKLNSDRWDLLLRLEDARWRCCFNCFRLHPPNEFSTEELIMPASSRSCIYGLRAAVARLCPCTEITFRDKMKITKKLLSFAPGHHQCFQVYDAGRIRVQRKFTLFLDQNQELVVETEYTVTAPRFPENFTGKPVLICPHRSIKTHMLMIQYRHYLNSRVRLHRGTDDEEPLFEFINGRLWKVVGDAICCPWCSTIAFDSKWFFSEPGANGFEDICTFTTRRCFGNAVSRADDVWYRQTEASLYSPAEGEYHEQTSGRRY